MKIISQEEKTKLNNIFESIKSKLLKENLSFEKVFLSKDFFGNGYLKFNEIKSILEKELGLFNQNIIILKVALSDDEDRISLSLFEKLLYQGYNNLFEGEKKIFTSINLLKAINEKKNILLETLKNIDYEGKNTVSFKQLVELLRQNKILTNEENELYQFFCENKLIVDVYDDMVSYNELFSLINVYLKISPPKNEKQNINEPFLKNLNMNVLESIKKMVQDKLRISKISTKEFFENIEKSSPIGLNLSDFKYFLANSLGLHSLLEPEQIEKIFVYFDADNDGKLSLNDFKSAFPVQEVSTSNKKNNRFQNKKNFYSEIDYSKNNFEKFQSQKRNINRFDGVSHSSLLRGFMKILIFNFLKLINF